VRLFGVSTRTSTLADAAHEQLELRILELLSNSAASAGLATPLGEHDGNTGDVASKWLTAHPEVMPHDPWLAVLGKVD
jgi:hypothetical protein